MINPKKKFIARENISRYFEKNNLRSRIVEKVSKKFSKYSNGRVNVLRKLYITDNIARNQYKCIA